MALIRTSGGKSLNDFYAITMGDTQGSSAILSSNDPDTVVSFYDGLTKTLDNISFTLAPNTSMTASVDGTYNSSAGPAHVNANSAFTFNANTMSRLISFIPD